MVVIFCLSSLISSFIFLCCYNCWLLRFLIQFSSKIAVLSEKLPYFGMRPVWVQKIHFVCLQFSVQDCCFVRKVAILWDEASLGAEDSFCLLAVFSSLMISVFAGSSCFFKDGGELAFDDEEEDDEEGEEEEKDDEADVELFRVSNAALWIATFLPKKFDLLSFNNKSTFLPLLCKKLSFALLLTCLSFSSMVAAPSSTLFPFVKSPFVSLGFVFIITLLLLFFFSSVPLMFSLLSTLLTVFLSCK